MQRPGQLQPSIIFLLLRQEQEQERRPDIVQDIAGRSRVENESRSGPGCLIFNLLQEPPLLQSGV